LATFIKLLETVIKGLFRNRFLCPDEHTQLYVNLLSYFP
jgi:hypothetical protein